MKVLTFKPTRVRVDGKTRHDCFLIIIDNDLVGAKVSWVHSSESRFFTAVDKAYQKASDLGVPILIDFPHPHSLGHDLKIQEGALA